MKCLVRPSLMESKKNGWEDVKLMPPPIVTESLRRLSGSEFQEDSESLDVGKGSGSRGRFNKKDRAHKILGIGDKIVVWASSVCCFYRSIFCFSENVHRSPTIGLSLLPRRISAVVLRSVT